MKDRLSSSLLTALLGPLTLGLTSTAFGQATEDPAAPVDTAPGPALPMDPAEPSPAPLPEAELPGSEPPEARASETEDPNRAPATPGSGADAAGQAPLGEPPPNPNASAAQPGTTRAAMPPEAPGLPATVNVSDAAASRDDDTQVIFEVVPASGYPSWQVRGIPGGSLAATMHGMQWPYLPAVNDRDTLRVAVSGFFWNDLSYARIESGLEDTYPNQKRLAAQSRGVLRVSPTLSTNDGWFAQAQGEFVIHGDLLIQNSNLASTDDLYVRLGKWNLFDITVGRFQAWEIANHYGMGLDINTLERNGAAIETQAAKPAPAYGLTYFWDRKDGRLAHYAAHLYPTDYLRFEMLAELGTGTEGLVRQTNFRPSAILDLGYLKLKGGLEYGTALPQGDGEQRRIYKNGFGGAAQFVFSPWLEGGVSFARGYEDLVSIQGVKDVLGSNTVTGYGGFLNASPLDSLVIGVGVLRSEWENLSRNAAPGEHYGDHDTNEQWQQFVAVQYNIWEQYSLKLVGSHAKFDLYESSSTPFSNEMWGLRFRMAVAF